MLQMIIEALETGDFRVQREAAWAICNALASGSDDQLRCGRAGVGWKGGRGREVERERGRERSREVEREEGRKGGGVCVNCWFFFPCEGIPKSRRHTDTITHRYTPTRITLMPLALVDACPPHCAHHTMCAAVAAGSLYHRALFLRCAPC